jgi:hypothetical protein
VTAASARSLAGHRFGPLAVLVSLGLSAGVVEALCRGRVDLLPVAFGADFDADLEDLGVE